MNRSQDKAELLALLRKPLLTQAQLDRLIAKATTPRTVPPKPAPKWYVSLWRIGSSAVIEAACGITLGAVGALLLEYWGFVS